MDSELNNWVRLRQVPDHIKLFQFGEIDFQFGPTKSTYPKFVANNGVKQVPYLIYLKYSLLLYSIFS